MVNLKEMVLIGGLILAGGGHTGGNFNNYYGENNPASKERYEIYKASKLEEALKKERENIFEQRMKEQSSDEIKIPYYKFGDKPNELTQGSCSKYAKKAAKKLFKKNYYPDHAWDLKYDNKMVYQFKENETSNDSTIYESLKNLIINETLKPGMIVIGRRDMKPGEYKKYKSYKAPGKDKKGNKIEDTHVMLYIGINDKGEEEFAHNWYKQIARITVKDFKDLKNLKPTLILDSQN